MAIFDNARRVRIEGYSAGPERPVSPRVVSVAFPERFQTTALVSLGKGYIPDEIYFRSNVGAQVHELGSNIIKRYNSKRRLAPF